MKALLVITCVVIRCMLLAVPQGPTTFMPLVVSTDLGTPPGPELPRPVRLHGIVQSIATDVWVVGGHWIVVTGETIIDETAGQAQEGARVWVTAVWRYDGVLVATLIRVAEEIAQPRLYEFSGIIEEIGPASWMVGGHVVLIEPDTEIVGDAQLGRLAHVDALAHPDGRVTATRIVVEHGYSVEFEGVIESVAVEWWSVSGVVVLPHLAVITGVTPEVGRQAEVSGYLHDDGTVLATLIRVLERAATATPPATPAGPLMQFLPILTKPS
jgi:hypothetical protein